MKTYLLYIPYASRIDTQCRELLQDILVTNAYTATKCDKLYPCSVENTLCIVRCTSDCITAILLTIPNSACLILEDTLHSKCSATKPTYFVTTLQEKEWLLNHQYS